MKGKGFIKKLNVTGEKCTRMLTICLTIATPWANSADDKLTDYILKFPRKYVLIFHEN